MTVTVQSICDAAAQDLNIIMAGEHLSANDGAVVLRALNRLFDLWNTRGEALYTVSWVSAPLVPAVQPHTVGPTGIFVVPQRPVSIESAHLIFPGSTESQTSIAITRDPKEWADVSVPAMTSSIPSGLYYQADSPNGSIYLYPVPDTAYSVELLIRATFSQVSMLDSVELPPGYLAAVTLTLEEDIAPPFSARLPERIEARAREARAAIFALNEVPPRIATVDAGMPGSGSRERGTYHTGWWY